MLMIFFLAFIASKRSVSFSLHRRVFAPYLLFLFLFVFTSSSIFNVLYTAVSERDQS